MRTAIAAIVTSVTLLACIAAPAGARPSPPPPPQQDSVTGSALNCGGVCPEGTFGSIYQSYTADAHSDPDGTHPSGTMGSYTHVAGEYDTGYLTVTCLSVSGHTAIVGVTGTIRVVTLFWMDGFDLPTGGLMRITDGGVGAASGLDTVESQLATDFDPPYLPVAGPTDCSTFPSGVEPVHNVDGGDLVVTDAPTRPATEGECRDGGWARYGFNNQGQCIAYVERGAKPTN